ncbi:hypothetical protein [Deinococcus navajonensis]|uniref:Uncharacterized protein n=1 Tax=Deinococcus navajonensis TaxID=309884 RepID=A0ABV8XIZ6_9DEIO
MREGWPAWSVWLLLLLALFLCWTLNRPPMAHELVLAMGLLFALSQSTSIRHRVRRPRRYLWLSVLLILVNAALLLWPLWSRE